MSESEVAAEGPVDIFALVGTDLERKFRIEKIVAEGGFGVVYYGTHLTLEKPVAVKVLKTPGEFNDKARAQFIEKFALEGKTMARISHPNIVQVLDFGASMMPSGEMAPWMVLEWLAGQTLEAVLLNRRGKGPFTAGETLSLLKPVLEALAYAHDEGIAHRDIKPANMMLVQTKRGGTLRLMDFGIAKLMDDGEEAGTGATRTRTGLNAFSPQYAAPEQLSGTRSGPWTDVHAMALIISEMLTDKQPYDGQDMTTLFSQILNPTRPTPVNRGAAAGPWDGVLTKALSLRPDERYKNAAEFLGALEESLPAAAHSAGTTGAFAALASTGVQQSVPTGVNPSGPTTLRGAEVSSVTAVPMAVAPKSRMPIVIGAVVVLVAAGAASVMWLRGGTSGSNSAAPPISAAATTATTPPATPLTPTQPAAATANAAATATANANANANSNANAVANANANATADAAVAAPVAANGNPNANPAAGTNANPNTNPAANANTHRHGHGATGHTQHRIEIE